MPTILPLNLGTTPDDGTGDTLRAGGQKLNDSFSSVNINAIHSSDTGIIDWGGFSIDGSNLTFTVEAGNGKIINNEATPNDPGETAVSWLQTTGNIPLNIATQDLGYVLIDITGTVIQQNITPTSEERRKNLILGFWGTGDNITLISIQPTPDVATSKHQSMIDMFKLIGLMKTGLIVSGNAGGNLSIDISSGGIIGTGLNYVSGGFDPNIKSIPLSVIKPTFRATQTGILAGGTNLFIDNLNFDVAGVVTTISGSNNQATNLRIFQITDGNVVVLYGQEVHPTLCTAVQNADKEDFITTDAVINGVLIAIVSVTKGATDLTSTSDAKILITSLHGSVGVGSSGITTATFTSVYTNSTIKPQLETTTAIGSVQFKRGSSFDTDNVFEILNGGGLTTFCVTGAGDTNIFGDLSVIGTTTTLDTTNTNILDNLIVINAGESGAGVTLGIAGHQTDRGSSIDVQSVFVEATQNYRIGEIGSLQAIATREDAPNDDGIAHWDSSTNKFETRSDVVIDTSGNLGVGTSSPNGKTHIQSGVAGGGLAPTSNFDDLVIESSGATGISLLSPDGSSSQYTFWSPGNLNFVSASIKWNFNDEELTFLTNMSNSDIVISTGPAVEKMRIKSGGNVLIGTTTDTGQKLQVNGDIKSGGYIGGRVPTAVSGIFGVNTRIIGVTDTTAVRTITLATAALIDGKLLDIKDESGASATNNIIIATEGTELIDGASSISIIADFGIARLYSDGTDWFTR